MTKDFISVITPVYGDSKLVKLLYDAILETMSKLDVNFEIIMVNDCCPYGSGLEIKKLALQDKRLKFINLSRNYGQHLAIKAGLDNAIGNFAVVMDCDLQDNPKDIVRLYKKIKETSADAIFGSRKIRNVGLIKKLYSRTASFFIQSLSDYKINTEKNCGNFSIFNKKVLDSLQKAKEPYFVFSFMILNEGFSIDYIDIEQEERPLGKSGYSFFKGIKHLIRILINNSNKPLLFSAGCAFIMFFFCALFIAKLVFDYYTKGVGVSGWTSIMATIFFIASLIFAHLGLMSIYIGQIFKITQGRPIYNIKERIN